MSILSALTLSLSILFTTFSPTQTITAEDGSQITYTQPAETLILSTINSEGYHFTNPETNTGAFIPASEASQYHVSSLKQGNIVTMEFNQYGDILSVNGKGVN